MTENAERCGDPVAYTDVDTQSAIEQIQGVNYHTEFEPAPGVKVMFHDAGHILGSSFITLDVAERPNGRGEPTRLVFSGDVGNDDVPILPETEALHRADFVVCESTYGNSIHEPPVMRQTHLAEFARTVLNRGGTLVIPAFSIERTQEILYELDNLLTNKKIPKVPIYLDSPMAIRATAVYRHFSQYLQFDHPVLGGHDDLFSFPSLKETLNTEDSILINDDKRAKIIIAGNGMMTGGRVLHHLKRYISDPLSGVLIVGYQAQGTLGRKILEKIKTVRIYGKEYPVRCEVRSIEAFSAHADMTKLLRWLHTEYGSIEKIFLVHGDNPVKDDFAKYLKENLPAKIIIPHLFQSFEL
jgi:metallo-beta-lactamase family protein